MERKEKKMARYFKFPLIAFIIFTNFNFKKKEIAIKDCPPEKFQKLTQKPIINIFLDSYELTKEDSVISNFNKFEIINFEINFITISVPRECYFFERVDVELVRNKRPVLKKSYKNVDSVPLDEFKKIFISGDRLMICPFPKLKNGVQVSFCPDLKFIKLKE